MTLPPDTDPIARKACVEAAHIMVGIIRGEGTEVARSVSRGTLIAHLRAMAAIEGWPEVFAFVQEQARGEFVPARGERLKLVVSNTAEIVKGAA